MPLRGHIIHDKHSFEKIVIDFFAALNFLGYITYRKDDIMEIVLRERWSWQK